jgi:hypothetical protein
MKRFLIPLMALSLLTGCSAANDPAALITSKPDQASNVAMVSALQSVVTNVESTRDAEGKIGSGYAQPAGYKSTVHVIAPGDNYCLVITDPKNGNAKTYTSINKSIVDGSKC